MVKGIRGHSKKSIEDLAKVIDKVDLVCGITGQRNESEKSVVKLSKFGPTSAIPPKQPNTWKRTARQSKYRNEKGE